MTRHLNIKDMQIIAADYGGKCLSKEFINMATPLEWMCSKGHTWDSPYSIILQGGWCIQCARGEKKKLSLEEFQKIAKTRGGKLISKEYINSKTHLEWQCSKGHTWLATPNEIKRESWCRRCHIEEMQLSVQKIQLKEFQKIAKDRGGKLFSEKYVDWHTKLKWQCSKGHIWNTSPNVIKMGSWCPACQHENMKSSIEEYQDIAKLRGGKLISKKYINSKIPLKWQCKEGHTWLAAPTDVKNDNNWCRKCTNENMKLTIEEFQKIAKDRGGKLLSEKYIDVDTKLKWQCAKGHVWMTTPALIKHYWCRKCSNENKKLGIELFRKMAKDRNGKLLSEKYINIRTKLKWQCSEGHTWLAVPANIKGGTWCPACGRNKTKPPIELFHKIAKEKKGKLLSTKYIDSLTKLKWQCSKGHIWTTTPDIIKRGSWCPACVNENTILTIEEFQKIAKRKKGMLLSKKYINNHTPLKWQCNKGHIWMARPNNIKNGTWCRICSRKKSK